MHGSKNSENFPLKCFAIYEYKNFAKLENIKCTNLSNLSSAKYDALVSSFMMHLPKATLINNYSKCHIKT